MSVGVCILWSYSLMLSWNHLLVCEDESVYISFRIQWFAAVEQNCLKWIKKSLVIISTNFICNQMLKFYWFDWSCTCMVFECIQQFVNTPIDCPLCGASFYWYMYLCTEFYSKRRHSVVLRTMYTFVLNLRILCKCGAVVQLEWWLQGTVTRV